MDSVSAGMVALRPFKVVMRLESATMRRAPCATSGRRGPEAKSRPVSRSPPRRAKRLASQFDTFCGDSLERASSIDWRSPHSMARTEEWRKGKCTMRLVPCAPHWQEQCSRSDDGCIGGSTRRDGLGGSDDGALSSASRPSEAEQALSVLLSPQPVQGPRRCAQREGNTEGSGGTLSSAPTHEAPFTVHGEAEEQELAAVRHAELQRDAALARAAAAESDAAEQRRLAAASQQVLQLRLQCLTLAHTAALRRADALQSAMDDAGAARHAAQRRHAEAELRAERAERAAAMLQLQLDLLAEQHAETLQRTAEAQRVAEEGNLHIAAACREAWRAAKQIRVLQGQHAGLRCQGAAADGDARVQDQPLGHDRGAVFREQVTCTAERMSIAEAEGRGSVNSEHTFFIGKLAAERDALLRDARVRCLSVETEGGELSRAWDALRIDHVCHWVALYVQRDWAPVCSTAARAVLGVASYARKFWSCRAFDMGMIQSRGRLHPLDAVDFGSEPGPLFSAKLLLDQLDQNVVAAPPPRSSAAWCNRWRVYIALATNTYEAMRLEHKLLFYRAGHMNARWVSVTRTLTDVLDAYDHRHETA
eukprot:TRINITY_DN7174_c0_g1_i6.p1 TRINITY_DN7174_c0_g1~~TRINITY_DN7174_c0_g1_i6.p1  ORF type:complete len:591 (+),score=100.22 TRINITY_DN7174_c0_g1_i6:114-1886(+)